MEKKTQEIMEDLKKKLMVEEAQSQIDTDEELDTADIEEEWIDFMKRSTDEAMERMITVKIQCRVKTH